MDMYDKAFRFRLSKRIHSLHVAAVLLLLLSSMARAQGHGGNSEEITAPHRPGTVIVKFREETAAQARDTIFASHGVAVSRLLRGSGTYLVDTGGRSVAATIRALKADPHVAYAEPDYVLTMTMTPNDPYWPSQWGPQKVSAPQAWDVTTGTSGTLIAVVDTGVELTHPDLAAKVRTDIDYDFVNADNSAADDNGHGTHVAGIAAATTNNAVGVAGMCPACSILPVKVLDAQGSGSMTNVADGIRYAADHGARAINLSLGGAAASNYLHDALTYAVSKGALPICAAGNSNTSAAQYPASYAECVAVAATDTSDNKTSPSNYGSWVDTSAPGNQIYSTYKGGTYAYLSGTSMAAAHVTGLAGLLFSQGRTLDQVRTRLTTAPYTDAVNSTIIPRRINAYKAVQP